MKKNQMKLQNVIPQKNGDLSRSTENIKISIFVLHTV